MVSLSLIFWKDFSIYIKIPQGGTIVYYLHFSSKVVKDFRNKSEVRWQFIDSFVRSDNVHSEIKVWNKQKKNRGKQQQGKYHTPTGPRKLSFIFVAVVFFHLWNLKIFK